MTAGPRAAEHPAALRSPLSPVLPELLAAATVLAQAAYPLVTGAPARGLTVATVLLFAAASTAAAARAHGARWAARFVGAAVLVSFAAEAVGVATGVPFGHYSYAATLGPGVAGVPLLVPLAWAMMSYPALVVARCLTDRWWVGGALVGLVLAGWDLFLDPQMVAAGHWHWAQPGPALNGIPLTNTAGWLVAATLLGLVVWRLPGGPDRPEGVPLALYLWTFMGSLLANLAFFGRPAVALAGGIGMGVVAVPLLLRLRSRG